MLTWQYPTRRRLISHSQYTQQTTSLNKPYIHVECDLFFFMSQDDFRLGGGTVVLKYVWHIIDWKKRVLKV